MKYIISIVGRSGSGKTTLIEKLIVHLGRNGMKIAVIKHMKHDFDMDYEGKDTYKYRKAGACISAITNDRKFAMISDNNTNAEPERLIQTHFKDADIAIIEGYKEGDLPKIEVIGESTEPPLYQSGIKNIIAFISDNYMETDLPLFKRDDIEGICGYIENKYGKTY
jgi:molybdopterin-guanine dinucleotide biosynthesis protein MobB